jgi:hypothetical protein
LHFLRSQSAVLAHNRRRYLLHVRVQIPESARIMSDLAPVAHPFFSHKIFHAAREAYFCRRRIHQEVWSAGQEEFALSAMRKIEITSICVCALTELETSFIAAAEESEKRNETASLSFASFSRGH